MKYEVNVPGYGACVFEEFDKDNYYASFILSAEMQFNSKQHKILTKSLEREM